MRAHGSIIAGGCAAWLSACIPFLVPDMRTPEDHARALESRCAAAASTEVAPLLAPAAVDSVEPAYSYVKSGPNDREARLRGARLHVRPLPGATRETMARALECHEAAVVLGRQAPVTDDPYALPGRWLDIDVDSDGDGFVVNVRIDSFDDARQELERARRFASRRAAP